MNGSNHQEYLKSFDENKVQEFMEGLPFSLTNAQRRVVDEILTDLKTPYRMNRLLQGDVGSGKTVVASIGLIRKCFGGLSGSINGAYRDSRRTAHCITKVIA